MTDEEQRRWITAYHEAGHVLVAAHLRKANIRARVVPEHELMDSDHWGRTDYISEAASTTHEVYRVKNHEMLIAAGGPAAEAVLVASVCGDISGDQAQIIKAGARFDLEQMREIDKEFNGGKSSIATTLDYVGKKLILRSRKKLVKLATKLFERGELSYDEILRITRFTKPLAAPPKGL